MWEPSIRDGGGGKGVWRRRWYLVATAISEIELRLLGVEEHARLLGHHLGVDGLVGLHPHHQFIALALVLEDVTWDIPELQPHLSLALVQCLPTAQHKWHPCGWEAVKGIRVSFPQQNRQLLCSQEGVK